MTSTAWALLLGAAVASAPPAAVPAGFDPYTDPNHPERARHGAEWKRGDEFLHVNTFHAGAKKDFFEEDIKHLEEANNVSDFRRGQVHLCGGTLEGTEVHYRRALSEHHALLVHVVYGVRGGSGFTVSYVRPESAPPSADAEQFLLAYCR